MIEKVCVYCSSSSRVDSVYRDAAEKLGRFVAENGYHLVYGGGNLGLMGVLAQTVKNHGGTITSVNLELFVRKRINFEGADELVVARTMGERKRIMIDRSDAFIALPGGFGTLEELSEVLTLKQLHFHTKPIVILNTNRYYDHFLDWIEHSFSEEFVKEKYREIYHVTDVPEEVITYLQSYSPVELPVKWFEE